MRAAGVELVDVEGFLVPELLVLQSQSLPELVGFVVLSMAGINEAALWAEELESVFARVTGRFSRVDLRWRMRDYTRGLFAPVERKNGWHLAEYAGHRGPAGFQHLLNGASWEADAVRGNLRQYVAERLGNPDGVLIIDFCDWWPADDVDGRCNASGHAAGRRARSP
ncbi:MULTISPECIES: transposase [unclassified Streptomyces]|uniref:transposase n=1 Tax=unclassified Streptomyces TaxID=2593676 RepID=UPI0036E0F191